MRHLAEKVRDFVFIQGGMGHDVPSIRSYVFRIQHKWDFQGLWNQQQFLNKRIANGDFEKFISIFRLIDFIFPLSYPYELLCFLTRKIRSNQYWNSWNWLEVIRKRAKQLKLPLQLLRKAKDW